MKKSTVTLITENKISRDCIDEKLFQKSINYYIGRTQGENGIGTLSEKTVHATLKYYYSPNEQYHEIKIGKSVADICRDGEIYEIQSRSFHYLRHKLTEFLDSYEVTVIYPVAVVDYIHYINTNTGEVEEKRRSGKKGNLYTIIPELYSLKMFLNNPHFHLIITFMETEDFRLLDGYGKDKKIKCTKTDRVPTKLIGEFRINTIKEYLNFLPGFENCRQTDFSYNYEDFTSEVLAKYCGIDKRNAGILINILCELNLIYKTGSKNRYYTYRLN